MCMLNLFKFLFSVVKKNLYTSLKCYMISDMRHEWWLGELVKATAHQPLMSLQEITLVDSVK